ncbi:B12-binding domain-containing protein [Ammoniphilus sp. CFH 90114]|uniref:cobalamin B12-binding domain-containing protein n=1 Tax=Ammoniphilus sp. CFH 90114 TaxID=2493665 RepID=UPI00100E9840|nr:cobalamin-dependent protein [Ammoniphilus sp. CFH 90114]RXT06372.1 cobalamin-binding protein [Ammoniphilus sp. CFH 90114]
MGEGMLPDIEKFAEYLLDGRIQDAQKIIDRYTNTGYNTLFIYDQLFTQAMRYIGSLWENNIIDVADEHLATGVCDILLSQYMITHSTCRMKSRYRAMFFCPEGEQHYLGLKIVSSTFEETGWNVHYLGPNLPLEYALANAMKWKPDVIGISVSIVYHLPQISQYVSQLQLLPNRPTILLGGRLSERYSLDNLSTQTIVIPDLVSLHDFLEHYPHVGQESAGWSKHASS